MPKYLVSILYGNRIECTLDAADADEAERFAEALYAADQMPGRCIEADHDTTVELAPSDTSGAGHASPELVQAALKAAR